MGYKVVLIENEVAISLKLNNLIVRKEGRDIWIPLDDISMIVVDNLSSNITFRIISQLAEHKIGMIVCDTKHHPVSYCGGFDNHSHVSKILGHQLQKDETFYNMLWKEIVVHKIYNQARAYYRITKNIEKREQIMKFAQEVVPGDISNREAHAAKVYFNALMGNSFSRGNESILLNSGLDYGYSIIRGYLAKLCVGYGLNTQLGMHHKNEYNRFNLVDDLMEPVRPIVDMNAYELLNKEEYFRPEHRHALIDILNKKIVYKGKKMFISSMLDEYVKSYAGLIMGREVELIFPNVDNCIDEEYDEDEV